MARQGFGSPANAVRRARLASDFYTTGMEHSPTSATGTGLERTPWHATQRAAWLLSLQRSNRSRPRLANTT
jgi:hypothetical protein